jgi:hypothetical protein
MLKNHSLGVNVVAKSTDTNDMSDLADMYNAILGGHLYYELDMDNTFEEFLRDAHIYGTSIMRCVWDNTRENGLGDVRLDIIHPEFFRVDPRANKLEDAEWCGTEMPVSIEDIIRLYPEKGFSVRNAQATSLNSITSGAEYASTTADLGDSSTSAVQGRLPAGLVILRDMWLKDAAMITSDAIDSNDPTLVPKYPFGRHVVEANGVILLDEPSPYQHGKFPFVVLQNYKRSKTFWGMSEFKQMESMQLELNKRRSGIAESINLMANPVWIVEREAGVKSGVLNNKPGLVIRINKGTNIKRDAGQVVGGDVFQSLDSIKYAIDGVTGVHDVTQGRRPTGISAASAIAELQEAASYRIERKAIRFGTTRRELGSLMLGLVNQFYTEERIITVVGEDHGQTVLKYDPNLNGQFEINQFAVLIEPGSTMPQSRTTQFAQALQLAGTPCEDGQPAIDRQALLEAANFKGRHRIMERMAQATQAAQQAASQPQSADVKVNIKGDMGPETVAQALVQSGIQLQRPEVSLNDQAELMLAQATSALKAAETEKTKVETEALDEDHSLDVVERLDGDKEVKEDEGD